MSDFIARTAARILHVSSLVDRAVQKFQSMRTQAVLAFANERFLQIYSEVAYARGRVYDPGDEGFRRDLFTWEADAVQRFFPPAPARILIGGAGGGREGFALAERGYRIVAFDPSQSLVASFMRHTPERFRDLIEVRVGSYAQLPILSPTQELPEIDLRDQPPFDAVILGWCSLAHVPTPEGRRAALISCARLTRGPILISYFYQSGANRETRPPGFLAARAMRRWGPSMWSPQIGFACLLSDEDVAELAASAGLEVVFLEREKAWPHAVLRARS